MTTSTVTDKRMTFPIDRHSLATSLSFLSVKEALRTSSVNHEFLTATTDPIIWMNHTYECTTHVRLAARYHPLVKKLHFIYEPKSALPASDTASIPASTSAEEVSSLPGLPPQQLDCLSVFENATSVTLEYSNKKSRPGTLVPEPFKLYESTLFGLLPPTTASTTTQSLGSNVTNGSTLAPQPTPSPQPSHSTSSVSDAQIFRIRPLSIHDMADLAEMAKHTYGGHDYICSKLPHWLQHPELFICLAVTYEGPSQKQNTAIGVPEVDSDSISISSLHRPSAPTPPQTYRNLPNGQTFQYETITVQPRGVATIASPTPSSPVMSASSTSVNEASSPHTPPSTSDALLTPYLHRVISLEVLALFDDRTTAFLQALRVHPNFRGYGLSSLLHARLIHLAREVYHVRRIRETTNDSNRISLHLAGKHGLTVKNEFDCGFFSSGKQLTKMIQQVEEQLTFLRVDYKLLVDLNLQSGVLHRGRSDEVMDLVRRFPSSNDCGLLRQYWMLYECTENNLVYLCTEAVLPEASFERRNFSAIDPTQPHRLLSAVEKPYLLVTSKEELSLTTNGTTHTDSSPSVAATTTPSDATSSSSSSSPSSIGAFSISLVSQDHSGWFRSFSIYAPTPNTEGDEPQWRSRHYQQLLLHFYYQLLAAQQSRHETLLFECDDTGRPKPETCFTTEPMSIEVKDIQSSTPRWFAHAYQSLQAHIFQTVEEGNKAKKKQQKKAAVTDDSSTLIVTSPSFSSHLPLSPSKSSAWEPGCQMMALELEYPSTTSVTSSTQSVFAAASSSQQGRSTNEPLKPIIEFSLSLPLPHPHLIFRHPRLAHLQSLTLSTTWLLSIWTELLDSIGCLVELCELNTWSIEVPVAFWNMLHQLPSLHTLKVYHLPRVLEVDNIRPFPASITSLTLREWVVGNSSAFRMIQPSLTQLAHLRLNLNAENTLQSFQMFIDNHTKVFEQYGTQLWPGLHQLWCHNRSRLQFESLGLGSIGFCGSVRTNQVTSQTPIDRSNTTSKHSASLDHLTINPLTIHASPTFLLYYQSQLVTSLTYLSLYAVDFPSSSQLAFEQLPTLPRLSHLRLKRIKVTCPTQESSTTLLHHLYQFIGRQTALEKLLLDLRCSFCLALPESDYHALANCQQLKSVKLHQPPSDGNPFKLVTSCMVDLFLIQLPQLTLCELSGQYLRSCDVIRSLVTGSKTLLSLQLDWADPVWTDVFASYRHLIEMLEQAAPPLLHIQLNQLPFSHWRAQLEDMRSQVQLQVEQFEHERENTTHQPSSAQ